MGEWRDEENEGEIDTLRTVKSAFLVIFNDENLLSFSSFSSYFPRPRARAQSVGYLKL